MPKSDIVVCYAFLVNKLLGDASSISVFNTGIVFCACLGSFGVLILRKGKINGSS